MTFLNAALAFGALAFSIPLVIHILNRSRFRTVEWGAMHLLESVLKVNHRRFQIDQLILLLIRCLIPIILALALARPVLTGSGLLSGDAPVSIVVLLDNSYSMETAGASGTRYETAVAAVTEILAATSRGSEVAVIQTGGRPTPLFDEPVFDAEAVVRRLRQQQPGFGASAMPEAIAAGLATLASMSQPSRELLIVSDFQPADWSSIGDAEAASIEAQIDAMTIKPSLTLLAVGEPAKENLAVEGFELPQRILGVGQTLDVRTLIRNYGDASASGTRVVLRVDGEEADIASVSTAPRGSSQVLFQHQFETPGSHVLDVEVVSDDPLPTDNHYQAAVTIWDRVPVLLVDGDPSSKPLEGETDFLTVALTPFTFGRVRLTDLVETQTVRPNDLDDAVLEQIRVVVLANVKSLGKPQFEALRDYVSNGGSLMVCAGDKLDLAWYRETMFAKGIGLLPIPYGETVGSIGEKQASARIVAQRFEHPGLAYFNDPANGDLSTATFERWSRLIEMSSGSAPDADAAIEDAAAVGETVIAARLSNGDPLLVERAYGDGVVLQMSTACDADWSDLPMKPVYVPLMQQLVTTLASRISPPRNIPAGEPAVAMLGSAKGETVCVMETPIGERRTLRSSLTRGRQVVRYDDTQRPGIYTLTPSAERPIHFAASTPRQESELPLLRDEQIAEIAASLDGRVVESSAAYLDQDRLRRHGREIWKILLGVLLALLFLEVVLQQRFARVTG